MSITKAKFKKKFKYRFEIKIKQEDGTYFRKSSKFYDTKAEAKLQQDLFLEEYYRKKEVEKKVTVLQVGQDWLLDAKERKLSKSIIYYRERVINVFLLDWHDLDIREITPLMVRKKLNGDIFNNFKTSSKNQYRSIIKTFFNFAVKYYDLSKNPVTLTETFKATDLSEMEEKKAVSPETFKLFIMAQKDDDYARLFQFIYWLGLRISEALSLTFKDVQDGVLHCWRIYDTSGDEPEWKVMKTVKSQRRLTLSPTLMKIYQAQWDKYKSYPGFCEDWFIFGGLHPLKRATVTVRRCKAIELAGLPFFTTHDLRHSYISNMLAVNQNVFAVSRSAGHSNTQTTTNIYGHIIDEITDFSDQTEALIEKFDNKISQMN